MRGVAELQCRAIADFGAAGIGVGAEQHDGAAAADRVVHHRQFAGANAVGDVAGDGQRDAVGVDRAATGGVVDLEVVGEGQRAEAIGLK